MITPLEEHVAFMRVIFIQLDFAISLEKSVLMDLFKNKLYLSGQDLIKYNEIDKKKNKMTKRDLIKK